RRWTCRRGGRRTRGRALLRGWGVLVVQRDDAIECEFDDIRIAFFGRCGVHGRAARSCLARHHRVRAHARSALHSVLHFTLHPHHHSHARLLGVFSHHVLHAVSLTLRQAHAWPTAAGHAASGKCARGHTRAGDATPRADATLGTHHLGTR